MLAGAVQQYLLAQGMTPVSVDGFGDYTTVGAAAVSVHAESDADAELVGGSYNARVQLRGRASNAVAAENVARQALALLLSADGTVIGWDDPTGEQDRTYLLEAIRVVNRPTWYPTPRVGEETSCNCRLMVTET